MFENCGSPVLKVIDIRVLHEYKFCFKYQNKTLLPIYFLNEFINVQHSIHSYNTRGANDFQFPIIRHSFAKHALRYKIPLTYNSFPR